MYLTRVFSSFLGADGRLWPRPGIPANAGVRPRALGVRDDLQLGGLEQRGGLPVLARVAPAGHGGLGARRKLLVLRGQGHGRDGAACESSGLLHCTCF